MKSIDPEETIRCVRKIYQILLVGYSPHNQAYEIIAHMRSLQRLADPLGSQNNKNQIKIE